MAREFHFGTTPPEWVLGLPRDYKNGEGTVTKEVGVHQKNNNGEEFWKVFQLIEKDDGNEIRTGYYSQPGGWTNKPLMLPPNKMADLVEFAEGKIF